MLKKYVRKNGSIGMKSKYTPDRKIKVDRTYMRVLDINNIVTTFKTTGQIPPGLQRPGGYLDKSTGASLADFMLFKENTMDLFSQLPRALRQKFGDDPATFLASLSQAKVVSKEIPPQKVEVINASPNGSVGNNGAVAPKP